MSAGPTALETTDAPDTSRAGGERSPSSRLVLGIGYETVTDRDAWEDLAANLDRVGADGVTIAVGRPEWVLFGWDGHEETWASDGEDLVADAITAFGAGGEREITLVIDALVPRMIEETPALAAVDEHGQASEAFPGAAALDGPVGEEIVALCGEVAARYQPSRIALTELMIDASFSEADLAHFAEYSGDDDWPRDSSGEIDAEDSRIAEWRSSVVAGVVADCADAAAPHGVAIDMDVRANWDDPGADRAASGHAHADLLDAGKYLTVWNYFPLGGREPGYSEELTEGLAARLGPDAMDRVTMSVGLWTDGDEADGAERDAALAPEDMVEGLEASLTHGVGTVSVTPVSMMGEAHWEALEAWR